MSDVTITERQQYWLDHIRAAAAFDGSLAEYARSAGLRPKEPYSWKGILGSRGLLDGAATPRASGFVRSPYLREEVKCSGEPSLLLA